MGPGGCTPISLLPRAGQAARPNAPQPPSEPNTADHGACGDRQAGRARLYSAPAIAGFVLQDFVAVSADPSLTGKDVRAARRLLGRESETASVSLSPAVLQLIFLFDCSQSMRESGKMPALNFAVRELLPVLRREMDHRYHYYSLCIRIITFAEDASWVVSIPTPVEDYVHPELEASGANADLGAALRLLADELQSPPICSLSLAPVVVLVMGGAAKEGWRSGLRALKDTTYGPWTQRLAVGIGDQADTAALGEFASMPGRITPAIGAPRTLALDILDAIVRILEFNDVW